MAENTTLTPATQIGGPQAVGSVYSKVEFDITFSATNTLASGDYFTLYTPGSGYKILGADIVGVTVGTNAAAITVGDGTTTYGTIADQTALAGSGAVGVLTDSLRITAASANAVDGTIKVVALVTDIS
jgi:hypothetical protein